MAQQRLTTRFYRRNTELVARALLGKVLVHGARAGVIVETEAYLGPEDAASHARFGRTERNAVMFGHGGVSYVYLCYGIHNMFNVVSGRRGEVGAVLVRAISPLRGLDVDPRTASGPGKLARALGITRAHHGRDLTRDDELYLTHGTSRPSDARIRRGPRIGVDYAGDWAATPLRFWIHDHPAVSRHSRRRRSA